MYIQQQTSILTTATNENTIAGNQFEFARGVYRVETGLVASATGLIVDVLVSGLAIALSITPSIANRYALYPDDFPLNFGMIPGDRLICRVRNPTGGTLILYQTFKFTPVG